MVPHIRGQRSGRRPVALAIAAFLLVLLSPTAASAATPSWLDRQAGWHGRAIERPLAPRRDSRGRGLQFHVGDRVGRQRVGRRQRLAGGAACAACAA